MDDRRKKYRAWNAQQNRHDSISPRDALPEDDLVFFLLDLIPQIDAQRVGLWPARLKPSETQGACGSTDEYSDSLLARR